MHHISQNGRLELKEGASIKSQYVVTGAILANLMPLCAVVPPLWAFVGIYTFPLSLAEGLFSLQNYLLINAGANEVPFPHLLGFVVATPLWGAVGGLFGSLSFHIQSKRTRADLSRFQIVKVVGGMLLGTLLVGYVVVMLIVYG